MNFKDYCCHEGALCWNVSHNTWQEWWRAEKAACWFFTGWMEWAEILAITNVTPRGNIGLEDASGQYNNVLVMDIASPKPVGWLSSRRQPIQSLADSLCFSGRTVSWHQQYACQCYYYNCDSCKRYRYSTAIARAAADDAVAAIVKAACDSSAAAIKRAADAWFQWDWKSRQAPT